MSSSSLLRGTFILTLGTYISRILGMIYVFPFVALVGDQGTALYAYGYGQYTIFLSLSTIGVPMAVSKFISKYNALGDYETSRKMFKTGMLLMVGMGIVSFILLYSLAPVLAPLQLGDDQLGNSVEDVTNVIRMVSFALLIVPIMSVIRGFFQGNQTMEPTAVSQVIEQLVRIIFLLVSVYFILKVGNGELSTAIGYATFAAFVGALGGLAVLGWYFLKRRQSLNVLLANSKPNVKISSKEMIKELLTYAGPFVFVGLAIPLYQYVDQYTLNRTLVENGKREIAETIFSIIQFKAPKLVMIPVSLATAFGLTLVPAITKAFTDHNGKQLRVQIDQSFQVVYFLTLPAVVGLATLSYKFYAMFYNIEELSLGGSLLRWYAPVAILFAFFTVTAAILQGIQKQKLAVISLFFGLLLKLVFNIPFITWFGGIGSILATALGYLGSVVYSVFMIKRHANYSYRIFIKRAILMSIFALIMMVGIFLIGGLLQQFIDYREGRWEATIVSIIATVFGAAIYLYLSYRSNLAGKLLGKRFSFLKRKSLAGEKSN
ncbi:oligosaccharide flippase family protein [Bacillus salitolerans]|uniref:Oligosaccharide flippase family protein n=1 Tax=Bacillus salitolerans TaxID=1437434 RepID=A0ABW4LXX0_9BACI